MSDRARGIFRGSYDGHEFAVIEHSPTDRVQVTRAEYETMAYEPPYDTLPSRDSYEQGSAAPAGSRKPGNRE